MHNQCFTTLYERMHNRCFTYRIPVYGTQKKVAMAGIEPLTRKKVCSTNSHAYQLSQLVHYASADIFKYISTVPLASSSYFVIFLYLFLTSDRSYHQHYKTTFSTIQSVIIHQHGCNPSKASHLYI